MKHLGSKLLAELNSKSSNRSCWVLLFSFKYTIEVASNLPLWTPLQEELSGYLSLVALVKGFKCG